MRRGYAIIEIRKIGLQIEECKDLIVSKEKMKNIKNEIRSFGLSFFRDQKREEQKRGIEKRREEEEEQEGREEQKVWISMGFYELFWILV